MISGGGVCENRMIIALTGSDSEKIARQFEEDFLSCFRKDRSATFDRLSTLAAATLRGLTLTPKNATSSSNNNTMMMTAVPLIDERGRAKEETTNSNATMGELGESVDRSLARIAEMDGEIKNGLSDFIASLSPGGT